MATKVNELTGLSEGELISIARGGQHFKEKRKRKHRYSLLRSEIIPERWEHDAKAQIEAMETLSNGENPTVLNYLKKFTDFKLDCQDVSSIPYFIDDSCHIAYPEQNPAPYSRVYRVSFPRAIGPLKKELESYLIECFKTEETKEQTPELTKEEVEQMLLRNPFYKRIKESKNQLKT